MNFLFWNLKNNNTCFDVLCQIVSEEAVSVIALAEFPEDSGAISALETKLQALKVSYIHHPFNHNSRIELYYDSSICTISHKKNIDRLCFKTIKSVTGIVEINFVFCHLPSKIHKSEYDQLLETTRAMSIIKEFERTNGEMTVICGDFNLHPFEKGMVADLGFNTSMDSKIVQKRRSRLVSGDEQIYFYNPMWGLLGDIHPNDVPGTFYTTSSNISYLWHLFDQVIMRPDVIPFFVKNDLRILAKGTSYNLLSSNDIISNLYSDHLPIKFNINI